VSQSGAPPGRESIGPIQINSFNELKPGNCGKYLSKIGKREQA